MKMYAILRNDIYMSAGKAAAQAGHAFVHTTLRCALRDPGRLKQFHPTEVELGTRVVLGASIYEMLRLKMKLEFQGVPYYVVIDKDHVFPPDFDGTPIVTAIGIGPLLEDEAKLLEEFHLYELDWKEDWWRRIKRFFNRIS